MRSSGVSTCQAMCRMFLSFNISQPNTTELLNIAFFFLIFSAPVPAPSAVILVHTSVTPFNWVCSPRGKVVAECPTMKSMTKCTHSARDSLAVALRWSSWFRTLGFVLLAKSGKTVFSFMSVQRQCCPLPLTSYTFLLPKWFSTPVLCFLALAHVPGLMGGRPASPCQKLHLH